MSQTVIDYWNARAPKFDAHYARPTLFDRVVRRGMAMRARGALRAVRRGDAVLDLGCGAGRQVVTAVQERGAALAVGVDGAPAMLQRGRSLATTAGVADRVELREADFHRYEDPRRFDVVWALGVFDYETRPDALLARMAGWSRREVVASFRRGGTLRAPLRRLAYRRRGCPIFFHGREEVRALFARAGLAGVRIEKLDSLWLARAAVA